MVVLSAEADLTVSFNKLIVVIFDVFFDHLSEVLVGFFQIFVFLIFVSRTEV